MADNKTYFFDNPRNVKLVLYSLYFCCAVLLLLDFIIHRHISHNWERLLGFYSIYGFIGCVSIVFGAKWLRNVIRRDEDYYERDELNKVKEDDHVDE